MLQKVDGMAAMDEVYRQIRAVLVGLDNQKVR
jgi:hypothetical protein